MRHTRKYFLFFMLSCLIVYAIVAVNAQKTSKQVNEALESHKTSGRNNQVLLFTVGSSEIQPNLDRGNLSTSLRERFEMNRTMLSKDVVVQKAGKDWYIKDEANRRVYNVKKLEDMLYIYGTPYLRLGDSEWPLVFEDGIYSEKVIKEIVDDINLVYSRFAKHRILSQNSAKKYQIQDREVKAQGFLDFSINDGYFLPGVLAKEFGYLVEVESQLHCIISSKLIAEYQIAVEFKEQHKQAYRDLGKFIDSFGTLGQGNNLKHHELVDLFYFDHLTDVQKSTVLSSGTDSDTNPFKQFDLRHPSILSVYISNSEDETKGLFLSEALIFDRESKTITGEIPLVYVSGKWKVMFLYGD